MRSDRVLPGGWHPPDLGSRVACITGASYGVGRGIAEVLGQCGATVYVTGRSTRAQPSPPRWTVEETAELIDRAGGTGIAVAVDHTEQSQVETLVDRIRADHGRLDLLVNNVWQWGSIERYWAPSWEQPIERWDAMFGVGVRSHLLAMRCAIPLLVASGGGLIVSTQERPGNAEHFAHNIVVDSAAVTMQRMIQYVARELVDEGVTAILLYFGWVRTVNMGMGFDPEAAGVSEAELVAMTESPHVVGRSVAELLADREVHDRTGSSVSTRDLALQYGFTDVDGRIPASAESG